MLDRIPFSFERNSNESTTRCVPQAPGERRPRKMTPTKKTSNEILTVEEVAEFLKVHASTIYKLLKRREIPAFRVGADWRFHAVQIEEWVKSRTRAPEDGGES